MKTLFVVLVLAVFQPLVTPSGYEAKAQENPANANRQPQAQSPVSPQSEGVGVGRAGVNPTPDHPQPSGDGSKVTDWMQAITSIAILAVIIVQACIYRKQWKVMQRQWIAMRRGLIYTRRGVVAAENTAKTATDALRIAERPYLDVLKFRVFPTPFQAHTPITYNARIYNSGRTPAYDVEGGIYLTISLEKFTGEADLDYKPFEHPPSKGSMGPTHSYWRSRITPDLDLQPADIERLDKGDDLFLYVYGVERYKDGFTEDTHRLRYCFEYNGVTKRMEMSAFHNDAT